MQKFIGKSELLLIFVSVLFQLAAALALLRVASGSATTSPTNGTIITIPGAINQSVTIPSTTPQFVNPAGSGVGASILLTLIFVAANVIVVSSLALLYRKKKMKLFSVVVSLFLIFNVTELYFSFLLGPYSSLPILAAIIATGATIFAALRGSSRLVNILAMLLALELGSSFPILLQAPLNWIIPAAYALFDIYSIYFGRLGKLVTQVGKEQASNPNEFLNKTSSLSKWPDFGLLTVNFHNMEIGMADIAFYTMVPAVSLVLVNLLSFIVVMIAVDVGLVVSFYVFRNKEVAPGLPIPILMGLASLLIMFFLK